MLSDAEEGAGADQTPEDDEAAEDGFQLKPLKLLHMVSRALFQERGEKAVDFF